MVAAGAATTSIFKKGRQFLFMLTSPAEVLFEGLIDMAATRGLKTIAVINEDSLLGRAAAQGTLELARKRGSRSSWRRPTRRRRRTLAASWAE